MWKVRAPPPAPAASAAAGMQFGFDMGMGAAPVDAQDDDGNVPDEKWSASLVAEFDDHKCVTSYVLVSLATDSSASI